MKRILVGTDGSEPATAAVAWAVGFTLALDGELVVATVLEPRLGGADVVDPAEQRTRVMQLQEEWCAPVRAALPGSRTLVLDGDTRTVLLGAVADEHAEMLILGAGKRGWFPALHMDHVAHAIAQHTDVPLVIVPRDARSSVTGPLLVSVDGSLQSTRAVGFTRDLARSLGSEVIAVHAHLQAVIGGIGQDPADWRTELERLCNDWTAPLRAAGVATRVLIRTDWPPLTITDLEIAEQPALVVLGSRARGFHDLHLDSVALEVLHRAKVPVAIVPPKD